METIGFNRTTLLENELLKFRSSHPSVIKLVSVAARHHLWRLLRQWEADVDVEPGETVLIFVLLYTVY